VLDEMPMGRGEADGAHEDGARGDRVSAGGGEVGSDGKATEEVRVGLLVAA
jgi:hypothetical protein